MEEIDLFLCFDALHPCQYFFSHVGMFCCLPGLNQYYKQRMNSKFIVYALIITLYVQMDSSSLVQ